MCVQDFPADAWGMGLCLLHLLTGHAPYEEVAAPLKCPAELKAVLESVWCAPSEGEYMPLREVLADSDTDGVLYHTLYRYMCIVGISWADGSEGMVRSMVASARFELHRLHACTTLVRLLRAHCRLVLVRAEG